MTNDELGGVIVTEDPYVQDFVNCYKKSAAHNGTGADDLSYFVTYMGQCFAALIRRIEVLESHDV